MIKHKPAIIKPSLHPSLSVLYDNYHLIVEELYKNQVWLNWGSDSYDPKGHCKFLTGSWTICPVYFGNYTPDMLKLPPDLDQKAVEQLMHDLPIKFPQTRALLQQVKNLNFAGFSRLHPHSKLAPHRHVNPFSYIFHLGLIIPEGETCGLKVKDQVHIWKKPGDFVIFDDTFEHSAWNDSDQERVVLYVDFPRNLN